VREGSGGIDWVLGETVHAVTDPRGPVNMGAGSQFYIERANFAAGVAAPPPRPSPRLVAEERLRWIAQRFVAPPGYASLRSALREPGTVLLSGAAGSGRRTAAMMLLYGSGEGTARFRELPDENAETSAARLDPGVVEPGERLLLDLTDEANGHLLRELADYQSAVARCGAYLVVMLSERAAPALPDDLRESIARIGRPVGRQVLQRHLDALSAGLDVVDVPGLARHLDSDPMGELARLARLVHDSKVAADHRGTPAEWFTAAVAAMAVRVDEVADLVRTNSDGRFRATLLATAMFERTRSEVVHHAAETLLATLRFPEDTAHRWERPDLVETLRRIDARVDDDQRVRFGTVTYGQAVREHFWNSFPGVRPELCRWLETVLRQEPVTDRERAMVLRRFTDECLRTGHPQDALWLVDQWSREERSVTLIATASETLTRGVVDPRHGGAFRRRVYDWVCNRSLPRPLAMALVRLCAEAIAPTRPDQALVRLRHLTRNNNPEVATYARATLVALSDEDHRFLRRVLHRVVADLQAPQPREGDCRLFTELTDPSRLVAAPRALLAHHDIKERVVAGWHRLMSTRPHQWWTPALERWLGAHDPDRDLLLDVLVGATAGRSDLDAVLSAVVRGWAGVDPDRRRTAAELLRRSDLALDLGDRSTERTVR